MNLSIFPTIIPLLPIIHSPATCPTSSPRIIMAILAVNEITTTFPSLLISHYPPNNMLYIVWHYLYLVICMPFHNTCIIIPQYWSWPFSCSHCHLAHVCFIFGPTLTFPSHLCLNRMHTIVYKTTAMMFYLKSTFCLIRPNPIFINIYIYFHTYSLITTIHPTSQLSYPYRNHLPRHISLSCVLYSLLIHSIPTHIITIYHH